MFRAGRRGRLASHLVGLMGLAVLTAVSAGGLVVAACGGDTFTNDLQGTGGGSDSGAGVDARTSDTRDEPCAPGLSKAAFCSNFDDPSMRYEKDGWTFQSAQGQPVVRVVDRIDGFPGLAIKPTSGTNVLYVENNNAPSAYLRITRPNKPRHFRFAFDLRALALGNRPYVPARVAICASSTSTVCYWLQLRFGTSSDRYKPVYLEEVRTDTSTYVQRPLDNADTSAIDSSWSRVVLEANLEDARAMVTFGPMQALSLQAPADIVDHIDHVELSLGSVTADSSGNNYVLLYDTVTFDPEPP